MNFISLHPVELDAYFGHGPLENRFQRQYLSFAAAAITASERSPTETLPVTYLSPILTHFPAPMQFQCCPEVREQTLY